MKRIILVFIAVLLVICTVGCSGNAKNAVTISFLRKNTTEQSSVPDTFRNVAETDRLILSFNEKTTDIAVTNKSNGFVWSSANRAEGDETAYNILYLTYHTDSGNVGTLSTTFNCLSDGQYQFKEIENGVKVSYSLGDVATEYIYPETLLPDRFDLFYDKADEDGQWLLDTVYTKIDIGFYDEVTQAEMNEKYPFAKGGEIYIQRSILNDSVKSELSALFTALGYTKEDLTTDHTSLSQGEAELVAVNMSVYYKLDKDCFYVEVPEKEIQYNSYVHLDSVNVLECFAGQSMENGYFLLPDGSGSIMKFRNEKTAKNYRTQIYGEDHTINVENKLFDLKNTALPVYGCVTGENGYFAVVEDGESHAFINAASGTLSTTPRAWLDFTVEPMDYMVAKSGKSTEEDNKTSVYQTKRYDGSFKVKYRFLSGENANYSYMAECYRKDLFGDKSAQINSYPLTCEIVGAVDLNKTLFGFDYSDISALTDFDETQIIAEDLIKSNVGELNIILSGWDGIGVRNGYSGKFQPAKVLGGQKGLEKLIESLNKLSVNVFLNSDVQYSVNSGNSRNFAYFLDESIAKRFTYDPAVFMRNKSGFMYILSPDAVVKGIHKISEFAGGLSCGVSVKTVGTDINSDFNVKNTVDRQDSMYAVTGALAKDSENAEFITSVGNSYVLPYIKNITNVPVRSNGHDMTDYSVPFLAMVLSGNVQYSAPPLNDGYNEKTDLLRIIESGAGCSAVFTYKDAKSENLSEFDLPTETCYKDLKNTVISSYELLKDALSDVYGNTIVSHTVYENGIREVQYENGIKFYINYSYEQQEVNGIKVPPTDFVKEGN